MTIIKRYSIFGYILAFLGIFSSDVFASTPPGPPPPPIYPINENVTDTITVHPELSKSQLDSLMKQKLRPNRGLTHFIPTKIYVKSGEYLRLSPEPNRGVSVCINNLETKILCQQRAEFNYSSDFYLKAKVDGEVYIENLLNNSDDVTTVTITGGHEMPVFRLGEHTDSDFVAMLNEAITPNIHLISPTMIITGPIAKFKSYGVTDSTALMEGWENIITWGQQDYGFSSDLAPNHQPMSHKVLFLDVGEEGAGLMFATRYHLGTGTDYAFNRVVKTSILLTDGGWGPWHEYGHTLQPFYMQFKGMTEVTTNITSQKVKKALGYNSQLEDRWDSQIFSYLERPNDVKDYFNDDIRLLTKLGMFWQLDLAFGPRFYQRMSVIMRNTYQQDPTLYNDNFNTLVQRFIRVASLTTGYDLRDYFIQWGVSISDETQAEMNDYVNLASSANLWKNTDLVTVEKNHDFGRDVAIHYRHRQQKIKLTYDYFRTWLPNQRATVYLNNRYLGEIENNQSEQFTIKLDQENALVKAVLKQPLNRGDKIKVVFDAPQSDTATYKYKVNDIRMWANSDKDKITVNVNRSRFNNANFSLQVDTNGNRIFNCESQTCVNADVRFKNGKVIISKQFQLKPNQSVSIVIGKANGEIENVVYAK